MVQQGLSLEKVRDIPIAELSESMRRGVEAIVRRADMFRQTAINALHSAEKVLLTELDLVDWAPPQPLTYARRASDVMAAGRFDADYFTPRVKELMDRLFKDRQTVANVAPARREKFVALGSGEIDYIEISDLASDGTTGSTRIARSAAPSRATWHVRAGDVITSTVRPIRRLSALITPDQDGSVASSGFLVLKPMEIESEVLLSYLRLPVICELMDLHTSASLYPAISDTDLLALPFPKIDAVTRNKVAAAVRSAHEARRRARELLERAKRAVEIAIEESEERALRYLDQAVP